MNKRNVNCFDLVKEALRDLNAADRLDHVKLDILRQYCGFIDRLSDEFEGRGYEVEINEKTFGVTVSLFVVDLCVETPSHYFFALLERTVSHRFTSTPEAMLRVDLEFPSLLKR